MSTPVLWMSRLYASLLRLYPPAFRQELGPEMQAVFNQVAVDAERSGWLSLLFVCWRELRDLPGSLAEAHRSHPKGGFEMKTPDYSRWFGDPQSPPNEIEPRPWRHVWLGVGFFILFLVSFTSYGWSQLLPFEKTFAIKIGNIFSMVSMFIFLGLAILGGIRKFPDWSLPFVGFVVAMLSMAVLIYTNPNRVELWMAVLFFISPMIVLILVRLIKPTPLLWTNILEDPTRMNWLYMGLISLAFVIILDDQDGEFLFKSSIMLFFIPVAIFYLRANRLWQRVVILPISFLMAWVAAITMSYDIFHYPLAESWDHGLGTMVRIGLLILAWFLAPGLWILLRRVKWITPIEG